MVAYHYHTSYIDLVNCFNYMVILVEIPLIQLVQRKAAIKTLKDIITATITNIKALANK